MFKPEVFEKKIREACDVIRETADGFRTQPGMAEVRTNIDLIENILQRNVKHVLESLDERTEVEAAVDRAALETKPE